MTTNSVSVNGGATDRRAEYFHREIMVANGSGPVWQNVTNISGTFTNKGGLVFPANSQTLNYDLDGNLTFDGIQSYEWDAENRLKSVTMTNVASIANSNRVRCEFAYDFMGRRALKNVYQWNGSEFGTNTVSSSRFVYDGWNLLAEISGTNSTVKCSYLWGNDLGGTLTKAGGVGGLLMVNLSGTNCFAAYDGNGNITALINAADKSLAARYEYSPFYELLRATGPMAHLNPFRSSTKFWDDESGLVYYGYRYYNPRLGRWISKDPLQERGGLNLYGFCHNAPVFRFDTNGREDLASVSISAAITASIDAAYDVGGNALWGAFKGAICGGFVDSLHDPQWSGVATAAYHGALKGGIEGAFGYFAEEGLSGIAPLLSSGAKATLATALSAAENGRFSKAEFAAGMLIGMSGLDDDKILDLSLDLAGSVGVDFGESVQAIAEIVSHGRE